MRMIFNEQLWIVSPEKVWAHHQESIWAANALQRSCHGSCINISSRLVSVPQLMAASPAMYTPTLEAGDFLIFNNGSSRYVVADSSSTENEPVKTADSLDEKNPDNNRFTVTITDGLYKFVNVANGLGFAPGNDDSGNSILVWRQHPQPWKVSSGGSGIWDINTYYDVNTYWRDNRGASSHTILLVSKVDQGDRVQWSLIAA
jgi:hypothetical protein